MMDMLVYDTISVNFRKDFYIASLSHLHLKFVNFSLQVRKGYK